MAGHAHLPREFMLDTNEILLKLESISQTGYGEDLPGSHDRVFIELAQEYELADGEGRQRIRDAVPAVIRQLILGFGDRLATVAARRSDEQLLWFAYVAHSIEDFRHDERENTIRLALLQHVARKLGLDPSALIERIADVSSSQAEEKFRAFDARPPELKTLGAMGIVEEQIPSGIIYRYG